MNVAVVRAASAGLAHWIRVGRHRRAGVVVGFDHRHLSDVFARDSAAVLAGAGMPVRLACRARGPRPSSPTQSAPRRRRRRDGDRESQPGRATTATRSTTATVRRSSRRSTPRSAPRSRRPGRPPRSRTHRTPTRIAAIGEEALDAYLDAASAVVAPGGPRDLRVVYTPVHGVGLRRVRGTVGAGRLPAAARRGRAGEARPRLPHRTVPQPRGTRCARPRARPRRPAPRRPRARQRPRRRPPGGRGADGGGWRVLTGNEIGALLGDAHARDDEWRRSASWRRSVVSSRLLDRIAAAAGVPARATLTGFKWISRAGDTDGRRLVFGYEEALGYAVTPHVRDKDGLTAALALADLAAAQFADGHARRAGRRARSVRDLAVVPALRGRGRRGRVHRAVARRDAGRARRHQRRSRDRLRGTVSTDCRPRTCSGSSSPTAAGCSCGRRARNPRPSATSRSSCPAPNRSAPRDRLARLQTASAAGRRYDARVTVELVLPAAPWPELAAVASP